MAKTIMVVDDEAPLASLLEQILQAEGYKTITANSGSECLTKLKTAKPDLILMDMMMPGMTGKETVQKIRSSAKTKALKVVFVTVVRMSEAGKKELRKLGVLDYVTKPFDNAALIAKVKKYSGGESKSSAKQK